MTRKDWTRGISALWVVAIAACGGGGDAGGAGGAESAGGEDAAAGGDAAPAAAAPAVDPAVAATIAGGVEFAGVHPAMTEIDMSEEPVCLDKYNQGPPTTENAVGMDGRLANVFVYVKEGVSGEYPTPSEPVLLNQEACRYLPHVQGLQVGQTLLIKNSDAVLHNINTQPTANRGFNISQPQAGMESRREFSRPEVMIPVKCDVHGWMSSYVGVVSHPYFSVSDMDGSFSIGSLPPGTYTVEAWHELYGTLSQEVTVGEGETASITFGYSADMANADVPMEEPLVIRHAHAGEHETAVVAGAGR